MSKAVGLHRAKELMFTADLIDAATAERFGMLNHVCEADALEGEVEKWRRALPHQARFHWR